MNELERALVALGRDLELPKEPDVAPRVLSALAPQPLPAPRRLVLALALVVLAALLATLAIPDARSALLRFLHIGAARIELVDELPAVPPRSWSNELEFELALGEPVSLADARRRAGVELLELDEPPDRAYVGPLGEVWFLYGRPDAVRLLLVQTPRLAVDEEFIIRKLVDAGTSVEPLSVRGRPAYFLSGEPHVVLLRDEYGDVHEAPAWLARDVLVWEEQGRTLRMEGALTRDEALALAESLAEGRVRLHG